MKLKMVRRVSIFILAVLIVFGTSVSVFATTSETAIEAVKGEHLFTEYNVSANSSAFSTTNNAVSGTVPVDGSITLYPTLSSYFGFGQKLQFVTTSASTTGSIYIEVYNPLNVLVSKDWVVGVNDYGAGHYSMPLSGTYTMKIYAWGIDAPVQINAWWADD